MQHTQNIKYWYYWPTCQERLSEIESWEPESGRSTMVNPVCEEFQPKNSEIYLNTFVVINEYVSLMFRPQQTNKQSVKMQLAHRVLIHQFTWLGDHWCNFPRASGRGRTWQPRPRGLSQWACSGTLPPDQLTWPPVLWWLSGGWWGMRGPRRSGG